MVSEILNQSSMYLDLLLNSYLNSDYHSFTTEHQTMLESGLRLMGTPNPAEVLEIIRHELIAYGLAPGMEASEGPNQIGKAKSHHDDARPPSEILTYMPPQIMSETPQI